MGFLAKITGKTTSKTTPKQAERKQEDGDFRGVEVVVDSALMKDADCCQAVLDIRNTRFLIKDVPMLPLRGCDAAECRCSYKRYNDRRTDFRRTADVSFDIAGQFRTDENRSDDSAGRRRGDD